MNRHTNGHGAFLAQEGAYRGTDAQRVKAGQPTMSEMPVLGGKHPQYEPWRRDLIESLYADTRGEVDIS